jgi:hypothetical protein
LLLIALLCSRITLVLHELVGHGLTAIAVGAGVKGYHLFYFAGGYIEFEGAFTTTSALMVSLGGIALELVLGIVALACARWWRPAARSGPGRRIAHAGALGVAAIEIVHALYYLGAGTFHGYGDGAELHRMLGPSRLVLVAPVSLLAIAAAFLLARALGSTLREWLSALSPRGQLGAIAGAVAIAAAGHAALTFGELAVTPSRSYAQVMKHQSVREAEVELAHYYRAQLERGARVSQAELEAKRTELIAQRRPFPLHVTLAALLLIALALGVGRAAPGRAPVEVPSWAALRWPAAAVLGSLVLIAALRLAG